MDGQGQVPDQVSKAGAPQIAARRLGPMDVGSTCWFCAFYSGYVPGTVAPASIWAFCVAGSCYPKSAALCEWGTLNQRNNQKDRFRIRMPFCCNWPYAFRCVCGRRGPDACGDRRFCVDQVRRPWGLTGAGSYGRQHKAAAPDLDGRGREPMSDWVPNCYFRKRAPIP